MTRNTLVSAASFARDRKYGWSWRRWYLVSTATNFLLGLFVIGTKRPTVVVSYESALQNAEGFVDLLRRSAGLSPDAEMRSRAVAYMSRSRGYQSINRFKLIVNIAEPGRLVGWVSDTFNPLSSLRVTATLDGELLGEDFANRPRPSTVKAGFHETGRCGFRFDFDPPLAPDAVDRVRLFAPDHDRELFVTPTNKAAG